MLLQPALDAFKKESLILLLRDGEAQEMGKGGKFSREAFLRIGFDPDDELILTLVAIGIL